MIRAKKVMWSRFMAVLTASVLCLPVWADDWMGRISDETYLSQVSIPGVHDAGTGHGFKGWSVLVGDATARTQDLTLTELWNAGVRAFDLRPTVDGNSLPIYHGIIQTALTMEDAVQTLCGLLDAHPTETAIIIMRHESDHDEGSSEWGPLMNNLLTSEPVKSHAVNFTPTLKMKNVRGKLLILSRDSYATTPVGAYVTGWNFSDQLEEQKNGRIARGTNSATCYIQDYYDCTGDGGVATKWNSINTLVRFTAEQNTSTRIWAINHTSGYTANASSDGNRNNAAAQNKALAGWLQEHCGPTGIVVMDFGGVDRSNGYDVMGLTLVRALIDNNFKTSEYAAAIKSISTSKKYCIFTEVNNSKYYLTTDGYLTADATEAGVFKFGKVKGEEYGYGYKLTGVCFTNPEMQNGQVVLESGHIRTNEQTTPRDTWEAQVFLLNQEGRYAVRATNAAGSDSGWGLAAKTYWTVHEAPGGPIAAYSMSRSYIWQIEDSTTTRAEQIVSPDSEKKYWFDLSGRRVEQPQKGIYLHGNQKVIIK